jgi:arginine N-succinyltransferase
VFVIRESLRGDVDQVLAVAQHLDTVNLPAERELIGSILGLSELSFAAEIPREAREYLFVMEDTAADRIIGTSMVHAQHGTRRSPHVYLQTMQEERYSTTLDRYMVHQCIKLNFNYNGPTEIGGLSLLPEYRGHAESLGKLLSYVRFLFIAMHRDLFRDEVISELMPPLEADGTSKLWKHLGRRFTGLTYREADRLSKENKEFIWALFPHQLIYLSLLPDEVSEVIGKVGPTARPVERMLRKIGFEYDGQIDPFDGGPHFSARTDDITLVRDARRVAISAVDVADASRPRAIVASDQRGHFRAVGTRVIPSDDATVGLPAAARQALEVEPGQEVWMVAT